MPARRPLFGGWHNARSVETRDTAPCPGGNGTTVGTFQEFTLLCGSDVVGDTLDNPEAADFPACVDLCASHHPKCDAVSFNGRRCELKTNLIPERTHPSRRVDAAVGQFTTASSNCATLGGSQAAQGKNFGTFCGFIINGNDISQNFAATFQDCMGQCATTTGCGAISYDATQEQGFKNCYLKTTTSTNENIAQKGIDTAIINAAVAPVASSSAAPAPAPVPATTVVPSPATTIAASPATTIAASPATTIAASPATTIAASPATTVASDPAATSEATAGASFFTPPGTVTGATSVSPIIPPVSTQTVVSVVTFGTQTTAVTQTLTMSNPAATGFTFGTMTAAAASSPSMSTTAAQDEQPGDDGGSRAWIAAPVVGSAAAVVLIVLMFVMLGRRRSAANGSRGSSTTSSRNRSTGKPSPSPSLFTTWLPGSPSRAKSKMGNFSEVTGQKVPSRSSMRTSVIGIWRPGAEKLEDIEEGSSIHGEKRGSFTPVYEIKGGKAELRESMNGLGQNKWPPSSSGSGSR